ncbi:MAG: hypothetical protein ACF8R7_00710 [Phycisphaerales bacterium JB039]
MNRSRRRCRAAALLITLAAIALVTASLAALASSASIAGAAHRASRRAAMADDLLLASDAAVSDWLRRQSARIGLPLDAAAPRAAILVESFDLAGQTATLTMTGWDQQGMVPVALGRSGSPLRLTLPAEAQRALDAMMDVAEPYGVDQLDAISQRPAFPDATGRGRPALGALIATHAGRRDIAAININTAPLALLQAAMREAGAGGLEAILAARAQGKPARIGAIDTSGAVRGRSAAVALTDASSSWAVRTDITVGPLARSWWSVWERRSGAWRLAQRLEIAR